MEEYRIAFLENNLVTEIRKFFAHCPGCALKACDTDLMFQALKKQKAILIHPNGESENIDLSLFI